MKTILIVALSVLLIEISHSKENPPSTIKTESASISELTILSEGSRMPGLIYQAAGKGPHPTAIMLHGYPGNEKNLDLAQALRSAGWNALFFHYRGAWGSEGEFSFTGAEQDVQAVINYVQQSDNASRLKIDINKLSLVGHSMGGHMAIAGTLDNQNVDCAVSLDGANMGAGGTGLFSDEESVKLWSNYSDTLFMLNGWSGDKAVSEIKMHGSQLDLVNRAKSINNRPVFLIAADTEVIPIDLHIKPLQAALNKHSDKIFYKLINDDHSFSNTRSAVIEATIDFLDNHCL